MNPLKRPLSPEKAQLLMKFAKMPQHDRVRLMEIERKMRGMPPAKNDDKAPTKD